MPADHRDYKLDLASAASEKEGTGASSSSAGRPYVSVHFACCGVYTRIYRSADGLHYRGRCPRCAVPVTFRVGQGGTDARFFVVH